MPIHRESMPIVPLLLVGGIGYYLYNKGYFSSLSNAFSAGSSIAKMFDSPITPGGSPQGTMQPANSAPPVPPQAPAAPAPAPIPAIQPSAGLLDKIKAAAGVNSLNIDEWCYYYGQVTGTNCGKDPGDYPGGRETRVDIDTWYSWMLAPPAALAGLGQILNFGDFFSATPKRMKDTSTGLLARLNTNFR